MLPSDNRLKRTQDFDRAYRLGGHFKGKFGRLVVFFRRDKKLSRIGIVVSSKVGNAVVRNRAKRLVREVCRQCIKKIQPGYDVTYIVWDASFTFHEIEQELSMLLRKAHLLRAAARVERVARRAGETVVKINEQLLA